MAAPVFRDLEISDHVENKINAAHHVSADDVLDVLATFDYSRWDDDPDRGRRLIAVGQLGRRTLAVVLYPIDEAQGSWRLATAYPIHVP